MLCDYVCSAEHSRSIQRSLMIDKHRGEKDAIDYGHFVFEDLNEASAQNQLGDTDCMCMAPNCKYRILN